MISYGNGLLNKKHQISYYPVSAVCLIIKYLVASRATAIITLLFFFSPQLYGGAVADLLLSALGRLFTTFLQLHGFSLGVEDILVTAEVCGMH